MRQSQDITQELLEELLAWLDPSREAAGQKYEVIRARLIKIFVNQGCCGAEDLADITFNRVIGKLSEIRDGYVGDPISYFYGVARKVYLESRRRKEVSTDEVPAITITEADTDIRHECLQKCLQTLAQDQRELVLEYYLNEKRAKIDHRKRLAAEFGLTANALRLRAHRIRTTLEKCVLQCVSA
jgi:RNA polymerase sigma factor (sigma-70 family)